jgi:hypothetical protein
MGVNAVCLLPYAENIEDVSELMQRRIFGPKKDAASQECIKLYNEIYYLCDCVGTQGDPCTATIF